MSCEDLDPEDLDDDEDDEDLDEDDEDDDEDLDEDEDEDLIERDARGWPTTTPRARPARWRS